MHPLYRFEYLTPGYDAFKSPAPGQVDSIQIKYNGTIITIHVESSTVCWHCDGADIEFHFGPVRVAADTDREIVWNEIADFVMKKVLFQLVEYSMQQQEMYKLKRAQEGGKWYVQ